MQAAVQRSFGSQIPREGTPPQLARGPTSHGERSGEKSLERQRQDPAFNRPDTAASSKPAATGAVRLDQQHSVNATVVVTDRIGGSWIARWARVAIQPQEGNFGATAC